MFGDVKSDESTAAAAKAAAIVMQHEGSANALYTSSYRKPVFIQIYFSIFCMKIYFKAGNSFKSLEKLKFETLVQTPSAEGDHVIRSKTAQNSY